MVSQNVFNFLAKAQPHCNNFVWCFFSILRKILVLNSYASIKEAFIKQSTLISDRPVDWAFAFLNDDRQIRGEFSFSHRTNNAKETDCTIFKRSEKSTRKGVPAVEAEICSFRHITHGLPRPWGWQPSTL